MSNNLPPIKVFAGSRSHYLGESICKELGIELGKMNIERFADGEFEVCFEESIRGAEVYLVQSTFPNCDNLMELLLMIDAAKRASAATIVAVIPYFGWAPTIVTELLEPRTLFEIIKLQRNGLSDDNFNSTYKHITLYGVASAMKYLHKNKILHKDLKPDNILLDEYLHPKICDFGLSVKMTSTNKNDLIKQQKTKEIQKDKDSKTIDNKDSFVQREAGTPLYMAPEIVNSEENPYSEKSDVYSFAIIMYEMFSIKHLFDGINILELRKAIKDKKRPEFDKQLGWSN